MWPSSNSVRYIEKVKNQATEFEKYFTSPGWLGISNAILNDDYSTIQKENIPSLLENEFFGRIKNLNLWYNLSLIEGEYYLSNSLQLIGEIKESLKTCLSEIENKDLRKKSKSDLILEGVFKEYESFFIFLKKINHYYSVLIAKIASRLEKSKKKIVDFDINESLARYLEFDVNLDIFQTKYTTDEFLFLVNIRLAEIDEGYLCTETTLNYLVKLSSKIDILVNREAIIITGVSLNIIVLKSKFLIYKTLLRFKKDAVKEITVSSPTLDIEYSLDSLHKKLMDSDLLPDFVSKADCHYNTKGFFGVENINDTEKKCQELSAVEFNVYPIHLLCKLYKQNAIFETDENLLNEKLGFLDNLIIKVTKQKNKSFNTKVNFFAYETTLVLLYNTKLRLQSKKLNNCTTFSQINEAWKIINNDYKIYSNRLSEDEIGSFQFFRIYCESIVSCLTSINNLFSNTESFPASDHNEIIALSRVLLKEYHDSNDSFSYCIRESEEASLMPMYMTMSECTGIYIHHEDGVTTNVNVFIDSSYILPSNYQFVRRVKERDNLNMNRQFMLLFENINISQNRIIESQISSNESELKEKFNSHDKEIKGLIKEHQFNIVQLIGLYAGIITFILGSFSAVYRFEFAKEEMLVFIFVFTACISIFVILLKLVFNPEIVNINAIAGRFFSTIGGFFRWIFRRRANDGQLVQFPQIRFHNYGFFLIFVAFVLYFSLVKIKQFHSERYNQLQLDSIRTEKQKLKVVDSASNFYLIKRNDSLQMELKNLKYLDSINNLKKKDSASLTDSAARGHH